MEMSGLIASPSNSLLFGFSIRGGSEYRTGFFVSHVEPAGEADVQGVQVRCLMDIIGRVRGVAEMATIMTVVLIGFRFSGSPAGRRSNH